MAIHSELPIYKVAYDLCGVCIDFVRHMPHDVKKNIGDRILDECAAVVDLIRRANIAQDKAPVIDALLGRLHLAEFYIRLSCDKRLIGRKQYAAAIALSDRVGRQASGWKTSSLKRQPYDRQGDHARA